MGRWPAQSPITRVVSGVWVTILMSSNAEPLPLHEKDPKTVWVSMHTYKMALITPTIKWNELRYNKNVNKLSEKK